MKYTDILWDFNGTLLDDVESGIISINTLLKRRGKALINSVEKYRSAFTFPITCYYENVGFDLSAEPFDNIAKEWIAENQINIAKAKLYPDAIDSLEKFKKASITQTMISATKLNLLLGHVCSLNIEGYFDKILGLDNINAESKIGIAIEWKKLHPNAVPVFIGDTVHDSEVASAIGCDCVLVSRGHQGKEELKASGFPVFDSLKEATAYLTGTRQ